MSLIHTIKKEIPFLANTIAAGTCNAVWNVVNNSYTRTCSPDAAAIYGFAAPISGILAGRYISYIGRKILCDSFHRDSMVIRALIAAPIGLGSAILGGKWATHYFRYPISWSELGMLGTIQYVQTATVVGSYVIGTWFTAKFIP